jgi:hypothetical protein
MSRASLAILIITLLYAFSALVLQARDMGARNEAFADEYTKIPPLTDNKAYMGDFDPPRTFWVLKTGQVGAIFENTGLFGYGFIYYPICDGEICPSFESPEGSELEYLWAGALWVGGIVGSDTLVSVAADGWFMGLTEFQPPNEGRTFGDVSDHSVWTLFTDSLTDPYYGGVDPFDNRSHIPLNLRVANRAHTWLSESENYMIIYDMVITNIGDETIEDGCVGFYMDGDVYHMSIQVVGYQDDVSGALPDEGIAYIIDNDGDPAMGQFNYTSPTRALAFKFLQTSFTAPDTGYNWWISNGNPVLDFGPQPVDEFGNVECDFGDHLGTPTGDPSKYCMLSHAGWDYDQIYTDTIEGWAPPYASSLAIDIADGYDTKFLMSIGSFDLMPDSSVRVLYTTFTGENVHTDVDNLNNLPDDPDQYLANLDFTHIVANAAVADSLGEYIIDPNNPVMGTYVQYNSLDSVVIEWDPWGFAGVEGYEIYLYEVPADSLPYPGVAPPWIMPSELDLIASVDQIYRYTFDDLSLYGIYMVSMANRTAKGTGIPGEPLMIQPGGRPPAPLVDNEYIFIQPGDPAVLGWTEPQGVDIDYYNIYKFDNHEAAQSRYYPRYDTDQFSETAAPRDSFLVDGLWYYYYAMEPYTQIDSGYSSFVEYADDSSVYILTAVLKSGLESSFSAEVTVHEVPPRTKDIVAVICRDPRDFVECNALATFYDSLLQGYDYDIYNYKDTLYGYDCKQDWWKDLLPYRLVIIDGGLRDSPLDDASPQWCGSRPGFEKYMWSGGILAYCGSFKRFTTFDFSAQPRYYPVWNSFINDFFGIDSVFRIGILYYYEYTTPPFVDSLTGFIYAEPTSPGVPDLSFDSLNNLCFVVCDMWPENTAPSVSTFITNNNAEPIHLARSLYPSTSLIEGHPIGIKSETYATTAFVFGFHLWYMHHGEARALVDYMMAQTGDFAAASTVAGSDTLYAIYATSMTPMSDDLYMGNLSGEYTVNDVDLSSVKINNSFDPTTVEIITSYPDFDGPVMKLTYPVRDFIESYGPVWGAEIRPYVITGQLINGIPLSAAGSLVIVGHIRGDANGDSAVDVGDVVYIINYVFRQGPAPDPMYAGDVNCDDEVNVADAVYLINFIFKDGPAPCIP